MIALVALVTVLTAGSGSSGNRVGSSSRMAEKTYAPKIDSVTGVAHKNDATRDCLVNGKRNSNAAF
jgi:hypothetical protein